MTTSSNLIGFDSYYWDTLLRIGKHSPCTHRMHSPCTHRMVLYFQSHMTLWSCDDNVNSAGQNSLQSSHSSWVAYRPNLVQSIGPLDVDKWNLMGYVPSKFDVVQSSTWCWQLSICLTNISTSVKSTLKSNLLTTLLKLKIQILSDKQQSEKVALRKGTYIAYCFSYEQIKLYQHTSDGYQNNALLVYPYAYLFHNNNTIVWFKNVTIHKIFPQNIKTTIMELHIWFPQTKHLRYY